MKTILKIQLLLSIVVLAGCTTKSGSIMNAGVQGLSVKPPAFLAGPAGVLLTNQDGFSAHVLITTPVPGADAKVSSGDLLGRNGRFLYTPLTGTGVNKQTRKNGKSMSFIWDVPKNTGYALSEALQAYAPVNPEIEVTNVVRDTKTRISENMNGHPCHRTEVAVSGNGVTIHFDVWYADDAQQFPMRIQTLDGARPNTVDFDNLKFLTLPADALHPPDEFKKYDTGEMMVNELMIRETTTAKKKGVSDFGPDDSLPDDATTKWGNRPGQ